MRSSLLLHAGEGLGMRVLAHPGTRLSIRIQVPSSMGIRCGRIQVPGSMGIRCGKKVGLLTPSSLVPSACDFGHKCRVIDTHPGTRFDGDTSSQKSPVPGPIEPGTFGLPPHQIEPPSFVPGYNPGLHSTLESDRQSGQEA